MNRKEFLNTLILGTIGMTTLSSFKNFTSHLTEDGHLMPVLFIGHGSPMNGIEDNDFSKTWSKMVKEFPIPKVVLVISAHWYSRGTKITAMDFPRTIHDFGGFPQALFEVQYNAPGNALFAKETASLIQSTQVELDHEWGLDHGTWTIIRHMYPKADIPVLQLSIDYTKDPSYHFNLAKELTSLRKKGVLIIGSGNMIHNLRMIAWDKMHVDNYGFDWALQLNQQLKSLIQDRNYSALIHYEKIGKDMKLAVPTPEHYLPLLYTLGLSEPKDEIQFFNDKAVAGSLTMTSVKFG